MFVKKQINQRKLEGFWKICYVLWFSSNTKWNASFFRKGWKWLANLKNELVSLEDDLLKLFQVIFDVPPLLVSQGSKILDCDFLLVNSDYQDCYIFRLGDPH